MAGGWPYACGRSNSPDLPHGHGRGGRPADGRAMGVRRPRRDFPEVRRQWRDGQFRVNGRTNHLVQYHVAERSEELPQAAGSAPT